MGTVSLGMEVEVEVESDGGAEDVDHVRERFGLVWVRYEISSLSSS